MGLSRILKFTYDINRLHKKDSVSIQQLQRRRLLKLLEYAKNNSAFYSELYKHIEIKKNMDINEIPLIDKKTFMGNFDNIITVKNINKNEIIKFCLEKKGLKKLNNKYTVIHSSGTSGLLWISVFDDFCLDYEIAMVLAYKALNLLGYLFKNRPRLACIATENPHVGSTIFYKRVPHFFAEVKHFSIRKPLSLIVKELNKFNPHILIGYPSIIELLADQKKQNLLHISPKSIAWGGFMPPENLKQYISEAFNCLPFSGYFASEATGPIALECEYHNLHIYSNSLILEALDNTDRPVPLGKPGKAVITNLMNFTQPIIRYRLNDIVQLSPKKCQCGSPLPVIENIWGREGDIIYVKKSETEYEALEPILFNFKIPHLMKYRIIQETNNVLTAKIAIENGKKEVIEHVHKAIDKILREKGVDNIVKVNVEIFPENSEIFHTKNTTVVSKIKKA